MRALDHGAIPAGFSERSHYERRTLAPDHRGTAADRTDRRRSLWGRFLEVPSRPPERENCAQRQAVTNEAENVRLVDDIATSYRFSSG